MLDHPETALKRPAGAASTAAAPAATKFTPQGTKVDREKAGVLGGSKEISFRLQCSNGLRLNGICPRAFLLAEHMYSFSTAWLGAVGLASSSVSSHSCVEGRDNCVSTSQLRQG